jgi:hypothetical protein
MEDMLTAHARLKAAAKPADAAEPLAQAAQAMENLARQMAGTNPDGAAGNKADKGDKPQPPQPSMQAQVEQFAQRQQRLAEATRQLLEQGGADEDPDPQALAQMAQAQEQLNDQAAALLGNQAMEALSGAREAVDQAEESMAQAAELAGRGQVQAAQQSEQRAARALERAAEQAESAVPPSPKPEMDGVEGQPDLGTQGSSGPANGSSMQQAQELMNQAQGQLGQGQMIKAQATMQKAAAAVQQLRKQLEAQQKLAAVPARGPGNGADEAAAARPGADLPRDAAQRWGELRGELRTRVLQDWEAKYGDDYARIIKLYFEQVADRARKAPTRGLSP